MHTEDTKLEQSSQATDCADAGGWIDDDSIMKQMAAFKKEQRILIVDDEPDIVDEMKSFLENKGHVCETAYSAQSALKKLVNIPKISIVLTDVRMPGMSGLELLGELRKQPFADRQIEVIVLTGHAGRDEAIQALHNGAIDFLIKPVSLKKVEFSVFRAHEVLRTRFMELITRQKMAETLEEERRTSQIQREFISMVSHEFRTPLAIIDGSAQRLIRRKDQMTSDEIEERADRIRVAVTRMTDLIDDNLSATSLDAGNIKFTPTACRLVDLIKAVCRNQQELNANHRITFDPGTLLEVIVADAGLLEQVFVNVVANAIKYSPQNTHVDVGGRSEGDFTTITVRDSGIGIPVEDLSRLFKRYFRASNTTGIPGTGIGLYLVRRLVEMHGGTIGVESVEDEGSTITVTLPNTLIAVAADKVDGEQIVTMSDDKVARLDRVEGQ